MKLLDRQVIANRVAFKLPVTADRYDQIWAIQQELIVEKLPIHAKDKQTIDSILDILFDEYGYGEYQS